jgi:uncharacterized protein YdbL (DUF1318 family)
VRLAAALFALAAAAVAMPVAAPAQAPGSVAEARRAGIVGERYDGYLGYARAAPDTVRRQVNAINIKRRTLYIGLASRRRVTPEVAAIAAGCELLSRVAVGEVYMLADGAWRRRDAGEAAPRPEHCPAG